jgi:hypothetical protein
VTSGADHVSNRWSVSRVANPRYNRSHRHYCPNVDVVVACGSTRVLLPADVSRRVSGGGHCGSSTVRGVGEFLVKFPVVAASVAVSSPSASPPYAS